jgi:hypothetical protein
MASDAASDLTFPFNDPLATAERTGRARAVQADLEGIFGEPAPATARPPGAARVDRRPRHVTGMRRLSAASMGGIAAAALAGLAAGTLLVRSPKPAHAPPPTKPHPAALPVEIAPPVQTPQASDAAMAQAAPPVQTIQPPAAETQPVAKPAPRAKSLHGGHASVQSADRRLRAAYARAVHAGVPRALLAEDRERWESARRRYADDPARLAAAYQTLARELDRAAAGPPHQREAHHASPHRPNVVARFFRWL